MASKYNFQVMLLGNGKYTKEPEQIVMNSYDLNVEGDDDNPLPVPPKHIALQKLMDEYSENSSIENGSLCEMNCIPCYTGDKRSQYYSQKLKYYTTIGKDECPRIFDFNQYPFNEQFNNIPLRTRQKSFSNNSITSNSSQPEIISSPVQRIPLNNTLNIDNNESYYSDASMETNSTINTMANDSTYYIKAYDPNSTNYTMKTNHKNAQQSNKQEKLVNFKNAFHLFKKTIPSIPSEEEMRFNDTINLTMTSIQPDLDENNLSVKEITNDIDNLSVKSTPTQNKSSSKLKFSNEAIEKDKKDKEQEKNKQTVSKSKTKKHRSSVSKYDFVKVLVYLSGEHYYVLSRFLISRMLTATQVNYYHAVRIALDLKKHLVDYNELELSQKKLEKNLFNIMKEYGYNEKNIELYRLLSAFYRERIPMIILISGPRCVGKSTLATKLAERLNLPNIVKTDFVYDLMCSIFNVSEEDREPIWYRNCSTDELLEKYEKDCELVKKGLEADIKKAFTEGKSIIIEGTHVNHILLDFVLECITKFSNQQQKNDTKSKTTSNKNKNKNNDNDYSSKLLTVNDNPCNAIVLPFYLDMDDKKCHKEFLYNQMMKEILINNQNSSSSEYFMLNDFPKNINLGNDQLCEFESKIDIIGNLFRKENTKREPQKTSFGESKAFKYINVESSSFQNTLDYMHNEVLNKIQEKFNISE